MGIPAKVRTRLEAEERRSQILAVARRVFGENPYSAVSVAEIAEIAGVARGLVNHYFGDKRSLYLEVLRDMMAVPEYALEALPQTGSLLERAQAMVDRFLTVVERNRSIWLVTVDAMASRADSEAEAVMRAAENETVSRVVSALGLQGVQDERLHAALRAYGAMSRAASAEWLTHKTLSRADTLDLLASTMVFVAQRFLDTA